VILEKELIIDPSHPSLQGHFPGHAVVPGVVIVEEIFSAIRQHDSKAVLESVSHLKFLKPLEPGQICQLMINVTDYTRVVVECWLDGRAIVKGKLVLSRQEDIV